MLRTGIKHQSVLSKMVTKGIVRPVTIKKPYDYSEEDVKRALAYLRPNEHREFEKTEIEKYEDRVLFLEKANKDLMSRVLLLEEVMRSWSGDV